MHLPSILRRARKSSFTRWWMNMVLSYMIPFNRPHGFRVTPLPDGGVSVRVPFWRINRNHVNGIHACALATASEMASGLGLLEQLDPKQYRVILRTLNMEYHYQGKEAVVATSLPIGEAMESKVLIPLRESGVVDHTDVVELKDGSGNHIATGTATWQIKAWDKVRTKR